jgi:signal transduction histidine kinase
VTSRPWVWPVLTAILAIVAAALAVHPFDIAVAQIAVGDLPSGYMGVAAGLFGATAGLSAAGYRGSRDPRQLYLGLGAAVMATQLLVFGAAWPLYGPTNALLGPSTGVADPLYAITFGWLVAGVCFLLQWPWRDRRGRAPARASIACVVVIAVVAVADLVIVHRHPSITFTTANGESVMHLGMGLWILGLVALSAVAAAGFRAWRVGGLSDEVAGSALLLGSLSVVGLLLTGAPSVGSGWWQAMTGWTWLLPMTSGALLFAALVLHGRSESTRMRRVTDRAEAVLDGRAEIASMIAHEVRGPASTVRGIATTSLTHYDRLTDDERREFLGMIEQESRRLMTTVDQMSLALKVDAGSLTYHMGATDLAQIALVAKEAAELGDHPVAGFTDASVMVWADRSRMVEVVRQLLDNAATFSPPQSTIQLVVRRDGPKAEVEVIDQGPGIPPEQRENVFKRFPNWRPPGYQEMPGTGLGLFIARGIVAEHSGEISIEGGPEGGTILRMRLPAWDDEAGPNDAQGL